MNKKQIIYVSVSVIASLICSSIGYSIGRTSSKAYNRKTQYGNLTCYTSANTSWTYSKTPYYEENGKYVIIEDFHGEKYTYTYDTRSCVIVKGN